MFIPAMAVLIERRIGFNSNHIREGFRFGDVANAPQAGAALRQLRAGPRTANPARFGLRKENGRQGRSLAARC
jgi:hypothetical protein